MKKTLIASAIALTSIGATNANADMAVTQMNFSGISAASGSVLDAGGGSFTGSFFGHTWVADQVTKVLVHGDTWAGSNSLGAWDFTTALSNIGADLNQGIPPDLNAVGLLFDWSTSVDIPVLAVFDCATTPGVCTGINDTVGGAMQTGPFVGATPAFNGTGDLNPKTPCLSCDDIPPEVPIPSAVWLFGSGLIGLIGLARRKA